MIHEATTSRTSLLVNRHPTSMASFQSNKYPARLDALLSDLKSYRQSLQSKTFSENPLSGLNNLSIAKTSSNDGEFLKLVDVNILLVAFGLPTPICWPYALAAGFSERTVDLRFMESHGSIWRILRRPDPNPGTRILLQTNVSLSMVKTEIYMACL